LDIPFIQNILSKFPERKISFKISDIEFSYLKINSIKDDIIYTETDCLLERLEAELPNYYEKDIKGDKYEEYFKNNREYAKKINKLISKCECGGTIKKLSSGKRCCDWCFKDY
jgi:hypothetical protein